MRKKKFNLLLLTALAVAIGLMLLPGKAFAQCVKTADGSGVQCQTLLAGKTITAGTVCAEVVGTDLEVTYATTGGWEMVEAQLWAGVDLANMPQNNSGNPKIGQFPYKFADVNGVTICTFYVPLAALNFNCPSQDSLYYIAAHCGVRQANGSGGYETEGAWADGIQLTSGANWASYFTVTLTCDCGDPPAPQSCDTAFAFDDSAVCFLNIDEDGDGRSDFNRWGWSIGPLAPGSYTFDIYAGAGQCDIEKGALVGELNVAYTDSTALVTYSMLPGFSISETHLYVGNEILPRDVNNQFTVAPGQYPMIHEGLSSTTDSYLVTGLSGDIFIVAHAIVCE